MLQLAFYSILSLLPACPVVVGQDAYFDKPLFLSFLLGECVPFWMPVNSCERGRGAEWPWNSRISCRLARLSWFLQHQADWDVAYGVDSSLVFLSLELWGVMNVCMGVCLYVTCSHLGQTINASSSEGSFEQVSEFRFEAEHNQKPLPANFFFFFVSYRREVREEIILLWGNA